MNLQFHSLQFHKFTISSIYNLQFTIYNFINLQFHSLQFHKFTIYNFIVYNFINFIFMNLQFHIHIHESLIRLEN